MDNVWRLFNEPTYDAQGRDDNITYFPKQHGQKEHPVDAGDRLLGNSTTTKRLSSKEEIERMTLYMLDHKQFRDACIFVLGVNEGLRPSDILQLRWCDVKRDAFPFQEGKTEKIRMIYVNQAVRAAVDLYTENFTLPHHEKDFMFISLGPRKGHVPLEEREWNPEERKKTFEIQPVNIRTVSRTIRNAAKELGIYDTIRRVSAYSMRKTALSAPAGFVEGYKNSDDLLNLVLGLLLAQMMGNHASISTTNDHYTDLQNEVLRKSILEMNLGLDAIQEYKNRKGIEL